MKYKIITLVASLLFFINCVYYAYQNSSQKVVVEQEKPVDAIAYLIAQTQKKVSGEYISPKTTEELKAWFSEANKNFVPRVFVQKLPADFKEQGSKELFAQVISSHILRVNEAALKERAVLMLLIQKREKGIAWTEAEQDYFHQLVVKYDSKAKRELSSQVADLWKKINTIPPIVGVAMAAVATNWGQKDLESPFGQVDWLDNKTYAKVPYEDLVTAVDRYAEEMNGLPSLDAWRFARESLKEKGYRDMGYRALRWLNDYDPENAHYTEELYKTVQDLGYEIPDTLKFIAPMKLKKGIVTFKTTKGSIDFDVEYATTEEERAHGMMFRSSIPDKTGMIFLVQEPREMGFWMKNTFIPLDMIFFTSDRIVHKIVEGAYPLDLTPYSSDGKIQGVVEVPAGSAQKFNIKVGDTIQYQL